MDSLQTVGKVQIWTGIILGFLIGVLLILVSIYLLFFYHRKWIKTQALIKKAECSKETNNSDYKCYLTVEYTNKSGDTHTTQLVTSLDHTVSVGQHLTISYNPHNPDDVRDDSRSIKVLGMILGGVGVLILAGVVLMYIMRKNKTYQTIEGVSGLANVF